MHRRLASFALAGVLVAPRLALAADVELASRIDRVTVFPDAAVVTRMAALDLPAGASALVLRGLPASLDPASIRVEGEGSSGFAIGGIDVRATPGEAKPVIDAELERRLKALRDERESVQGRIAATQGKKAAIERYAQASPEKLGPEVKAARRRPVAGRLGGDRQRLVDCQRGAARAQCAGAGSRCRDRGARARPAAADPPRRAAPRRRRRDRDRVGGEGRAARQLSRRRRRLGAALRRPSRDRRQGGKAGARARAPGAGPAAHRRGLERRRAQRVDGAHQPRRHRARPAAAAGRVLRAAAADRRRPPGADEPFDGVARPAAGRSAGGRRPASRQGRGGAGERRSDRLPGDLRRARPGHCPAGCDEELRARQARPRAGAPRQGGAGRRRDRLSRGAPSSTTTRRRSCPARSRSTATAPMSARRG